MSADWPRTWRAWFALANRRPGKAPRRHLENQPKMQAYDVAMLAVLALATLYGFWKGLAWQLASVVSLTASYLAALHYSPALAPYCGAEAPWNRFVAMLVIYLGTSLAVWLVFRMLAQVIDRSQLTGFDRQAGALVGAIKGVLVCVAITFFAVTLSIEARRAVLASRSGVYIAMLIDRSETVMPPEIHQVLSPYLRQLDQQLQPGARPGAMWSAPGLPAAPRRRWAARPPQFPAGT